MGKKRVGLDEAVNATDLVKGRAFLSYLLSKKQLGFFSRYFVEDVARYWCEFNSKQGQDRFLKLGELLENNRPDTEGWRIFYRVYNEELEYICNLAH